MEQAAVDVQATVLEARKVAFYRTADDVVAAMWSMQHRVAVAALEFAQHREVHAEHVTDAVVAQLAGSTAPCTSSAPWLASAPPWSPPGGPGIRV